MKKKIVLVLVVYGLLVLDNTLVPFFGIKGVWPSLLFVFSIGYSLINGQKEALIIGLLSGFMQDVYFPYGMGINMLFNMICCYTAASLGNRIWREKRMGSVIIVFAVTIFKYLGVFAILHLLKINISMVRGVLVAFYNAIVMLLSYKLIMKFFTREEARHTWRF